MITRKDIEDAIQEFVDSGLASELIGICDDLFKERDAYREVAIEIHGADFINVISREKMLENSTNDVDAEAAAILERRKGESK